MNKKIVLAAGAVLAILLVSIIIWKTRSTDKVGYHEVTITKGDIKTTILSTGIVQPENRLEIKSPIAGRVDEVLVDEGESVKKGEMLVRMSSTERAALLDAARARSKEEFNKWDNYYKSAPILAPLDGTIISRNVEPGQTVTNQDAVLVMSDRLTVKAQVDETDIAEIKLKQKAEVILDAYPNDPIPAHVDKVAYDSKTINNVTTYIVDVLPEETPEFMRSGMTANVSFLIDSKENVLFAPTNAVRVKDGENFVLLPSKDMKKVELGISDGKRVEIVSGLSEGEKVLVDKMKNSSGNNKASNPFSPMGTPRRR